MRKAGGDRLLFVEPQLATLVEVPPKGDNWLHEIKFDGYRTQLIIQDGKASAYTRRGADWSAKYRPIVTAAADLRVNSAIVDGEVVAFDETGRATIEAFRSASAGQMVFVAFDLLNLDGEDLRERPCIERRDKLAALIGHGADGPIQFSEHIAGNGVAFYENACRLGLEGMVSKRPNASYRSGRSETWVKTKCYEESELAIAGIQRERGKPSFAVMATPDAKRRYVGSAFIALGKADRDRLFALAEAGGGTVPAGYAVKKNFPAEWIRPGLVGRVKYLRGEEPLRHARLVEIRAKMANSPNGQVKRAER